MSSPPDRSCRSGSPAGYDLYIWNCDGNLRTVIYQYSGEMSCQEPQKETAACGALTPIEQKLGDAAGPSCPAVPESVRWPR